MVDDGYSGGNLDRPGLKRLLSEIEKENIGIPLLIHTDLYIYENEKKNEYTYSAKINLINGGNYGYTFRAMPKHEMILEPTNLNLVKWITK